MTASTPGVEGWNHNTHYHDLMLGFVPGVCERALDVGCGTGAFARRLSAVAARVDAIDTDAGVVRTAHEMSAGFGNVRFIEADLMTWSGDGPYDFISMIASLHHMRFVDALAKASHLLRPGGVLAVLGLDRAPSVLEQGARSIVAYPVSVYHRLMVGTTAVDAPLLEPAMTLSEIRRGASELLPGAIVRRHLLWRYSLVWTKR